MDMGADSDTVITDSDDSLELATEDLGFKLIPPDNSDIDALGSQSLKSGELTRTTYPLGRRELTTTLGAAPADSDRIENETDPEDDGAGAAHNPFLEYRAMAEKGNKAKSVTKDEIVVFSVVKETACTECGEALWKGSLLRLEQEKALCMDCADLDRLEFLPSGNAAVTRRASAYSTLRAVVVRWSRARKRYERQGILAEPQAILRAEEESLADEEIRANRQARAAERRSIEDRDFVSAFARAIHLYYPGCPDEETTRIAEQACEKYSGRVGRTAAAKEFNPEAIRLAVAAHIRHVHTNYDALLARYADRVMAREEVRDRVLAILGNWQGSSNV